MKKYIILLINVLIWIYTLIICYVDVSLGGGGNFLLYSGISIGLLLAINLAYLERKIFLKEIIFILINIIFIILISYLTLVFIQLDVR